MDTQGSWKGWQYTLSNKRALDKEHLGGVSGRAILGPNMVIAFQASG